MIISQEFKSLSCGQNAISISSAFELVAQAILNRYRKKDPQNFHSNC